MLANKLMVGSYIEVDTGWINPAYSSADADTNNPETPFDGSQSTWMTATSFIGQPATDYDSIGYLAAINAREILQWGVRYKMNGTAFTDSRFETYQASDATALPAALVSETDSTSTLVTKDVSASDWATTGDSSAYLGASAGVLAWWAGGAGFKAIVQDSNSATSSLFYLLQVRVIYRA